MTSAPHVEIAQRCGRDDALELLGYMLMICRFEERCVERYRQARIRGFTSPGPRAEKSSR